MKSLLQNKAEAAVFADGVNLSVSFSYKNKNNIGKGRNLEVYFLPVCNKTQSDCFVEKSKILIINNLLMSY